MTAHPGSRVHHRWWAIVAITVVLLLIGVFAFVHNAAGSPTAATPATTAATPATTQDVVLGLGDSVTAGTNCDCADFVQLYAAGRPAAHGVPASAINLGKSGATSVGLLDDVQHDATTRADVARADIDLVTIGANDLQPLLARWQTSDCDDTCYDSAVRQVGNRVAAIVEAIRTLRAPAPTQILVTSYWNVFADGQVAREESGEDYLRWSDALTQALNTRICAAADSSGATCVDLYTPFKGDGAKDPTALLADDGDHPNAAGHRVIADALLAAGTPDLTR